MPNDESKKVIFYADDRRPEDKEIIEYLMKHDIVFSTIPTSGMVPTINYGASRYDGLEKIKIFVERFKKESGEQCPKR